MKNSTATSAVFLSSLFVILSSRGSSFSSDGEFRRLGVGRLGGSISGDGSLVGGDGGDRKAMWDIAGSLAGVPHTWRQGTDACAWERVHCGPGGRVISLALSSSSLSGSLPASSVDSLSSLEYIYLEGNSIAGAVPSLSRLAHLVGAYLSGNHFDSVPEDFLSGAYPNLTEFSISDNPLSNWSIPASLAGSRSLAVFAADNASLDGVIPSFLGDLSALRELSLSSNNLTGEIPESVAGLPNLQLFDVASNNLWGRVPSFGSGVKVHTEGNPLLGTYPPPPSSTPAPPPPPVPAGTAPPPSAVGLGRWKGTAIGFAIVAVVIVVGGSTTLLLWWFSTGQQLSTAAPHDAVDLEEAGGAGEAPDDTSAAGSGTTSGGGIGGGIQLGLLPPPRALLRRPLDPQHPGHHAVSM